MAFELTEDHLRAMFRLAHYEAPSDEMIFFGLRGTSPLGADGGFAASHKLIEQGADFLHMRCTIGQWKPGQGFAVYPGSTAPHISGVARGVPRGGRGVNMLAPCYLTHLPGSSDHRYAKGDHGLTSPLGPHRAFRNAAKMPVWRTADDTDFEGSDLLVFEEAFDNLHCARQLDPSQPRFSSLGCQVVAGQAGGPTNRPGGEKGPWKAFIDTAYGLSQKRFRYALFNEREAQRTVELGSDARPPTIRFGSTGELAEHLQRALIAAGHDIGGRGADGVVGFQTLLAIRDVQLRAFGPEQVDLVVGPMTAEALGIAWPAPGAEGGVPGPVAAGNRGNIDDLDLADEAQPEDQGISATAAAAVFAADTQREPGSQGKFRWVFVDPSDGRSRYLGGEAKFGGFAGLARIRGFAAEEAPIYSHADWIGTHGAWAALIEPTGEGESHNSFTCLNSYDRAAFTFGFFQLAAHTPGDNLIRLFRRLLKTEEAARYFPDLTLSGGKVHRRDGSDLVLLEGARDRADRANRPGEQGAFMEYLNADMFAVDEAERRAASRLVHWACHSADHRALQVEVAVEIAKEKVKRIASKVTAHGTSLEGRPMPQVAMALDILHQGRGGSATFSRIATALKAGDPMKELVKIGRTDAFKDRIDRVAARARVLLGSGQFGKLRYDAGASAFV